jgi:hypothetical protein
MMSGVVTGASSHGYAAGVTARLVLVWLLLVGCEEPAPRDEACTCTPSNVGRTKGIREDAPMTGVSLVARLRRHASDVALGKNPRDIKVIDDQLRFAIVDFCSPCAAWVEDRLTIEQMFPLDRLDEAASAVCMGLVLRDGTTVFGAARPRACR